MVSPVQIADMERVDDIGRRYVRVRALGDGLNGMVYEVRDRRRPRHSFARMAKESITRKDDAEDLKNEVEFQKGLGKHPNVVQLAEVVESDESYHLIMELCEEGDLCQHIRDNVRLQEREAAALFRQVALAVAYCHSEGIMHRDLKPENIMLTWRPAGAARNGGELTAKLGDFGLAARMNNGAAGATGSDSYMAPEVRWGDVHGPDCDIWSLGAVLHTMLTGTLPGWSLEGGELRLVFPDDYGEAISAAAQTLIRQMLSVDRFARPTAEQAACDPWLTEQLGHGVVPPPSGARRAQMLGRQMAMQQVLRMQVELQIALRRRMSHAQAQSQAQAQLQPQQPQRLQQVQQREQLQQPEQPQEWQPQPQQLEQQQPQQSEPQQPPQQSQLQPSQLQPQAVSQSMPMGGCQLAGAGGSGGAAPAPPQQQRQEPEQDADPVHRSVPLAVALQPQAPPQPAPEGRVARSLFVAARQRAQMAARQRAQVAAPQTVPVSSAAASAAGAHQAAPPGAASPASVVRKFSCSPHRKSARNPSVSPAGEAVAPSGPPTHLPALSLSQAPHPPCRHGCSPQCAIQVPVESPMSVAGKAKAGAKARKRAAGEDASPMKRARVQWAVPGGNGC